LGWGQEERIIGAVGQFSYRKGADLFIEAARILRNRHRNEKLRFVWFGGDRNDVHPGESDYVSAFSENMKSIIKNNCLDAEVNLMGHFSNIYDYFKLLDLFVLPSRDEGLPLSLLEAMAFKIPIVCTSTSGVPEAVRQDAAILVDPDSAAALAAGISDALENPKKNVNRVRVAFQRVCNEFDAARLTKRSEEVIARVVGNHKNGHS
jgi:glycosyltransferase involved in cell wall biosynthesis